MAIKRCDNLTVKHHAPFRMNELRELAAGESLTRAAELLSGYPVCVADGTALGLYRDGDMVPTDSDIDFTFYAEPDAVGIMEMEGMTLIRTVHWHERPIQTAFTDDKTGVIVDIYYYYADLIPGRRVAHCEGGIVSNPDLPIGLVDTKYGKLPFPIPTEQYLIERYGEDWETPQHGKKGLYVKSDK